MSIYDKILISKKLTKKLLMELPEGVYLSSNIYEKRGGKYRPVYADTVFHLSAREEQWKKIVEASANHRLCNVFKTKREYEEYEKFMRKIQDHKN